MDTADKRYTCAKVLHVAPVWEIAPGPHEELIPLLSTNTRSLRLIGNGSGPWHVTAESTCPRNNSGVAGGTRIQLLHIDMPSHIVYLKRKAELVSNGTAWCSHDFYDEFGHSVKQTLKKASQR